MSEADLLEMYFYGMPNPLLEGSDKLAELLQSIDAHAGELKPDQISVGKQTAEYSVAAAQQLLARQNAKKMVTLVMRRERDPEVSWRCSFLGQSGPPGLWLLLMAPLAYFSIDSEARSRAFVDLVRAIATVCPPQYGWAHQQADLALSDNPARTDPFAPKQLNEIYWLNVLGAQMVRKLGAKRVRSTPDVTIEELPDGGALLLSRPTPVDFASDDARQVQARALAHLRKDVQFDEALARLRARSAQSMPTKSWDADLSPALESIMRYVPFERRQQETERFNAYRPPEVSEQRPLAEALPADVDDEAAAIREYSSGYAEQLAMLLHDKVPEVMQSSAESLPLIDSFLYRMNYPAQYSREQLDTTIAPSLGGYLGQVLVKRLGGRWIPRRNPLEAQVVVGDRVWLPFLRASRMLQSQQSILDHSLTQLYRVAERAQHSQS
jgi:hypothetical protein